MSLLILLLVGIRSLRDADPGFARFQNGLLRAAPMPAFIDPNPLRPLTNTAPVFFTPAAPVPLSIPQPKESQVEKQFGRLEDLRETVHATEQFYRTGESPMRSAKSAGTLQSKAVQAEAALVTL